MNTKRMVTLSVPLLSARGRKKKSKVSISCLLASTHTHTHTHTQTYTHEEWIKFIQDADKVKKFITEKNVIYI